MITHTVIFRLARPVDPASLEDFVAALRTFAQDPPFAESPAQVRLDRGLRPEGRSVSEVALEARFPDADAFAAYLAAPAHVALVSDVLAPRCEAWLSIQSEE